MRQFVIPSLFVVLAAGPAAAQDGAHAVVARAIKAHGGAEVLDRQPPAVRRLLLRTSILERVNGELADLLTGAEGGERVLQDLEAAGAFVVSLDAARSWFRYHQMFAGLLRLELRRTAPGEVARLHAAAGGVGLILAQWAKHLGVTVIGTVGSDEKAKLAREHGCAHTIVYSREDFVKRVDEITGGKKVPVVYDSVGKDTFLKSLDCLAPLGFLALFGQSSGNVEPLNLGLLAQKGSLYVTRPTLNTYGAKRENLVAMAKELFEVVQSGAVKIEVHQTYPLKDAAKAHADLAARKTTGSTVLLV